MGASAAAGHDRVVPVLPAAAGRAPLPRPLRYRPRVLTGGCQARAHVGGAPRGLGRSVARRASRPPFPGQSVGRRPPVPVPDPTRPGPGRRPSRGPLFPPRLWPGGVRPQLTWEGAGEGAGAALPRPRGCTGFRGPRSHCPGGSGRLGNSGRSEARIVGGGRFVGRRPTCTYLPSPGLPHTHLSQPPLRSPAES